MKGLNCSAVLLALCVISHTVHATQSDNHGMHAVPVPGKMTIDGKLDDWDLSGQVLMCYDIETLRDIYSAQVALMYDAENLYVAVHFKDKTPLGNSHDPRYQADRGWAGDSVQLRIKTDRITHVTAWCYAAKNEPAIWLDYGKDLNTPFHGTQKQLIHTEGSKLSEDAEMAFAKDADGMGYVQEIKLPWKLITLSKKYAAGDTLNCGFELFWGEADWPVHRYADNVSEGTSSREFFFYSIPAWGPVSLETHGNLKLPVPPYILAMQPEAASGPVPIQYDLPQDARVTLAINDTSGKRVRNLIAAMPRAKGTNIERWDGLDDDGKLAPPGDYAFSALYYQGIHASYVMSFGSPGSPTWQTPDGKGAFYGDHSAAQAAAAAGEFVVLGCPIGEAGQHLIGLDLKGQRKWGLSNRGSVYAGRISLATDGKTLWVAQGKTGTIYRVNVATGKYAPWNASAKDSQGHEYQLLDLPVSDSVQDNAAPLDLVGIAVKDNVLAACLEITGKVRLLDTETGAAKGEFLVEAPRAAAYEPGGSLLVLSKTRLLRISKDGKSTPFNDIELAEAHSVACDSSGNVFVSVRGADQNVKVFSPDGKLIREIGAKGGRPNCGPYNENAMLQPAGIAVDSLGRLWVTEENQNPKRTSVWSADADGKLLLDFAGCTSYCGAGAINPFDPSMAFSDNTVYSIDLATGSWHPVYSFAKSADPADLFPPTASSHTQVVVHDGRQYVYTVAEGSVVHCMTLKDGRWHSVAAIGVVGQKGNGHFRAYRGAIMDGHEGQLFSWTDQNGDGLVQPDEVHFWTYMVGGKPAAAGSVGWGNFPDPDGTMSFHLTAPPAIIKFPVTQWLTGGGPVYDIANPQILPVSGIAGWKDMACIMGGRDGQVYINQSPLAAVDKNGKVLWTYPSRHVSVHGSHTASGAKPGYLIGPSTILGTADFGGEIGEVVELNGNLGENFLFTHDGLWIQSLFKDTRGQFETPERAIRGMPMDATTAGGESFGGNFIKTQNGKVYLTEGNTDARVLEITGLDSIKRFSGKFTCTPEQAIDAQRLAQEKAAKSAEPKTYKIARAVTPVKIDGKPDEWPELFDENARVLEIRETPQHRYARVQARYDDENLYLGYRVFAQTGKMRNTGQDYRLLFKSGDGVDLMLGPGESKNGAGSLRVLMSTMDGKAVAVLNQKISPGAPAPAEEHFGFSSPWRTIDFDRVVRLSNVKMASAQIAGGYFVEAAIPWSTLGLQPHSGLKLKGDVGVLSSDSGGTTTISRQYWSNKSTGLVNDVPGEADLTPGLWGEFILE